MRNPAQDALERRRKSRMQSIHCCVLLALLMGPAALLMLGVAAGWWPDIHKWPWWASLMAGPGLLVLSIGPIFAASPISDRIERFLYR